ncbi:unnamed protein product [Camellia sinensis]
MFARVSPDEMKMDESANYQGYRFHDEICDWIDRFSKAPSISNLHLACEKGDLQCVENLIRWNRNLCLRKNCFGNTALHIAAENGKVGVINLILRYCPESVEEVTATTMETCLHVAVKHNQIDVVLCVLNWIAGERPDFFHVLDFKDYRGKTCQELIQNYVTQTTDEPANYCEEELKGLLIWNYKIADLLLACKLGDLETVEVLIRRNRKLCFAKDGFGRTALHIAAENGKVDLINLILRYCPESVNEVTDKTGDTCLHVAVKNNQIDVVRHLLKCVTEERPDFLHVLDFKDCTRKTVVQFSKQFQALRAFLPLKSGGSVAIDISYDLSYLSFLGIRWEPRPMITWDLTKHKIKHTGNYSQKGLSNGACYLTVEKIKQNDCCSPRGLSNGSRGLTEEKIKHNDNCSPRGLSNSSRDFAIQIIEPDSSRDFAIQIIEPDDDYSHRGLLNWLSNGSIVEPSVQFRTGLLLIATLIAATTFQVPFHFLGNTSKLGYEQHSIMRSLIISCNSLVFIASVGVITYLLHEFPLKPLPHSLILALFGCYILSLHAIMPNGALVLFFISIPILLVGICKEALWLCKPKTHLSTSANGATQVFFLMIGLRFVATLDAFAFESRLRRTCPEGQGKTIGIA